MDVSPDCPSVDRNVLAGRTQSLAHAPAWLAGNYRYNATLHRFLGLASAFCWGLCSSNHPQLRMRPADGIFVTVQNRSRRVRTRIQATIDSARRGSGKNIKTIVFDFNPDGKDSATDKYGECYELAKYIRNLAANGINPSRSPAKVTRHTVAGHRLRRSGHVVRRSNWRSVVEGRPVEKPSRSTTSNSRASIGLGRS